MSYIGSKPANKPVVAGDLDPVIITGQTALGATPADTDEFIISDAGVLKRMDYSHIKGGGKVLQVVQATLGTEQQTTSTSFVAPGLNVSITPSATSSKVLIMMSGGMYGNPSSGFNYVPTIYRDSTNLALTAAQGFGSFRAGGSTLGASVSINYLDSPSSTSEITYHYYHKISTGTGYISYNSNATSTIIAMEIGA